MENLKITRFMDNPKVMYIKITHAQIDDFFSKGHAKVLKDRCTKAYSMFDFKRGILEANHLVKTDENRHTVDLLMFALGTIEHLEQTIKDLEKVVEEITKEKKENAEKEEQKDGGEICKDTRQKKTR